MAKKEKNAPADGLPAGLSNPARRALTGAGYSKVEELAGVSEAKILALHGVGPNAIKVLQQALAEKGLSLGSASK